MKTRKPVWMLTFGTLVAVFMLVTSLAWPQPLPIVPPDQIGLSAEGLAKLSAAFKKEIDDGKLPGVVILVARKGKIGYFESFGFQDKIAGIPMSKDAIFRIYSMTKPLVSVAAMILVEEGKMELTDPVSKFLPAMAKLQVSVPRINPSGTVSFVMMTSEGAMTIQDLLRHTAGLAYGEITANVPVKEAYKKAGVFMPGKIDFDCRGVTPQEEVDGMAKSPLAHNPGTVWEYSLATDVLGRVVEAVSGKTLEEFLRERIFQPLKMSDTGFHVPQEKTARLAQPFPNDPATGAPVMLLDVSKTSKNASGGAGGVSTAADYLTFSQMLLNGGKLNGARILSRPTVNLMTSDHLGDRIKTPVEPGVLIFGPGAQGYSFGLGFGVRKGPGMAPVPGSTGEFTWAGYGGTYFWVDPKEELVGVFMSQAPGAPGLPRSYYRKMVRQLVYQAIAD